MSTIAAVIVAARVPSAHEALDEAEVDDLRDVGLAAALAQDDVRRLDVAVDEAERVRLGERAADLPQDVDHAARRLRPVASHEISRG